MTALNETDETKLDLNYPDELTMTGCFQLCRLCGCSNLGGICVYIRDTIKFTSKHDASISNFELLRLKQRNLTMSTN